MATSVESHRRKKVAIVGSGAAGVAALWALNRTHHDVYLYEAAGRLGGQTNTVEWKAGKYKTLVDTGFMVMNSATYPNFLNFLNKVHVKTAATDLTFGVSRDEGRSEWAGSSLDAIFCQRRNLLSPRMWRMLFDILRFKHFALDILTSDGIETGSPRSHSAQHKIKSQETIRRYLERESYSDMFRDDYIIPITAVVWGGSAHGCPLEFPAVTLIRLMWTLGLLSPISSRAQWLTIPDGSRAYTDAVMRGFPSNHRFLHTAVKAVSNDEDGRVQLQLEGGRLEVYDHVILATQGDEAYSIVEGSATPEEKQILSQFRTSTRTAILHGDVALMPRSHKAWSSWNCITASSNGSATGECDRVSLTYNMNMLQCIPRHVFGNVLVTLDPLLNPHPKTVQGRYNYRQPLYDASTAIAQQRLARIQNTRGISYAGAWTRSGLHEDALSSGLRVAQEHLGARLPFHLEEDTFGKGSRPVFGILDLALRLVILIIQVFIIEVIDRAVVTYRAKRMRRRPHINGLSGVVNRKKAY